jgi:hypothetical protein
MFFKLPSIMEESGKAFDELQKAELRSKTTIELLVMRQRLRDSYRTPPNLYRRMIISKVLTERKESHACS